MDNITLPNGRSNDSETQLALSRRSFISVAVGAFTALPAAVGGFCLPAFSDAAYADEGASSSPSTKIVIAKANQSGFVVVDLANNGRKPVANANVKITSLSNEKTVSGTTDGQGLFLADITQLAKKETDENGLEMYSFDGTIEVNASGYRVYRTGRVTVKGAKGYEIPTRSIGTDRTYPSMVSFDDWDVLYTNNEFAITEANDTKHTLTVEIRSATNAPLVVHLKDAHGKVLATQQGTPEVGVCKVDIARFFLLTTHDDVLPVGSGFSIAYSFEGNEYRVPLRLSTVSSPTGVSAPGTGNIALSPFGTSLMKLQVTFPDWVPLLRGQKVQIWKPDVNLDIAFDPFGYFRIAYKADEYGYKSKNGEYKGDAWKMHPRSTYAEGYSKAVKERKDIAKKSVPKIKNWKSFDFEPERSLSATIAFEAGLAGRWNADSALWRAMLEFKATLGFNFSYALQMFLGPVPVIVEFGFATSLTVGLSMGVATPEIFSLSKYRFDYTNTGISYTIVISPTLSIGVGVKGVASVSLQGVLGFTFFVSMGPAPKDAPTDGPHLVVGLKAILNVVIQFFLFTMPIKWCGYDNPKFYDNWTENKVLGTSPNAPIYPPDSSSFDWFLEEDNQPQPLSLEAFDPLVEMSGEIDEEERVAPRAMDSEPQADEEAVVADYEEAVVTEHTTMEGLSYRTLEWVAVSDKEQADDAKTDDAKAGDSQAEKTQADDAKADNSKADDAKADKALTDDPQADEGGSSLSAGAVPLEEETASGEAASSGEKAASGEAASSGEKTASGDAAPLQKEATSGDAAPLGKKAASGDSAPLGNEKTSGDTSGAGDTGTSPLRAGTTSVGEKAASGDAAPSGEKAASGEAASSGEKAASGDSAPLEKEAAPGDANGAGDEGSSSLRAGAAPLEKEAASGDAAPLEKEEPPLDANAMADFNLPGILNVDGYKVVEANVPRYFGNSLEVDLLGKPHIANESGLVPGVRIKIASSVLSDPRAKVVSLFGIPYLFRIAAVTINGQVRTRIIGQKILTSSESMGKPIVFDFSPGLDYDRQRGRDRARIDLWDYDFDVCAVSYPEYRFIDLNFFVISGKRPNGMATSLGDAVVNQAFSFVRFRVNQNGYITVHAQGRWAKDMQFEANPAYPYHCYSCPHIEHVSDHYKLDPSDPLGYAKSNTFIMTFLDRAMKSPDKVLSDKLEDVKPNIGMIMQYEADIGYKYDMMAFDLHTIVDSANLDDASIYQMTCNKRITADRTCGWSHITLRGGNASYHFLICTATHMDAKLNDKGRISRIIPGIKFMMFWDKCTNEQFLDEDSVGKAHHLIDWPGHNGMFLAAADGKLKSAQIVGFDAGAPRVVYEEVGPANFGVSSFGIDPTGTILYYPATRSGSPGFAYDTSEAASGNVSSKDLPEVKEHRIMASRLRNGKFCDPFVFAEVDYAVDSLDVVSVTNSTIGFVSTDIVDPEKGKADMYYTAIPFTNCLTVTGCEALSPFAFPGSPVVFNVTVRNDGNTFATGFTAQLHLKGNATVESTARVTFGADTIVESIYNPADANGALQNIEEGYVLAPGKSSVYKVVITVPDSWRGEKEVCVSAAEITIVGEGMVARSPNAANDEGETQIIDGDYMATYELDDSQALEYVAGSSEEDYDEDGAPFDMLELLGENHMYDEDDYDDDRKDDDDDYHMQLFDAPINSDDDDDAQPVTPDSAGGGSGTGAGPGPKMGDPLGPLSGFAVAAAAAGAAFAAYSARRTRIAREGLADSQDEQDSQE